MVLLAHEFGAEADLCFEHAERLNATDPRWPYLRGLKLALLDRDAAVPLLERAADRAGSNSAPRLRLAEILLLQGQLDTAEHHFRTVLAAAPQDPRAELGLARIALKRGEPRTSLEHLKHPLASPLSAKAASTLQVDVLAQLGEGDAAREVMQRASELLDDPPWPDPFVEHVERLRVGVQARLALADQFARQGRADEALSLVQEIVDEKPDLDSPYFLRGGILLRLGRFSEAEGELRKAAELAPDSAEPRFQLGNALFLQNKYEEAAQAYRQAIQIRKSHALAHFNLGICLTKLNQSTEAIAAFRDSLRFQPNYAPALIQLSDLLAQLGKDDEAITHLELAIRLSPSDQKAKSLLKSIRARQSAKSKG